MKKQATTGMKLTSMKLLMGLLAIGGTLTSQRALSSTQTQEARDTHGYKDFHDRIEEYEKLHKNAEKSLPRLKKTSKQEVIAAQQEALVQKIRELRSNARQGDIFTPAATVPPTLLQKLPELPDEVTYRILGSTLLLVDRKANLIIDFMPNAIP
jgi:hypothetical protein